MTQTNQQVAQISDNCRQLFALKLHDYGPSWRIMRSRSITDQLFIKANRIRSIQQSGEAWVNEGVEGEFIAIVNYGLIGIIQARLGAVATPDLTQEEALDLYDKVRGETIELLIRKNHDYGEAWRSMRVSSLVDLILTKIYRTKQIEDNDGTTLVSEGVEGNYMDMVNYAIFALIKLTL